MKFLYELSDEEADIYEKAQEGELETLEEKKTYLQILKACKWEIVSDMLIERYSKALLLSILPGSILAIKGFLSAFNISKFEYFLTCASVLAFVATFGICFYIKNKEYKKEIQELQMELELEDKKEEKKKTLNDDFILMITKDMKRAQSASYEGYEREVQALATLAKKYLKAKKEIKATSDLEVLVDNNEFMKLLVAIETVIDEKIKIHEQEVMSIDALVEAMEKKLLGL